MTMHKKILFHFNTTGIMHIVWDCYTSKSLEEQTRQAQNWNKMTCNGCTNIPKDWVNFF